jgi:hypothetical protein
MGHSSDAVTVLTAETCLWGPDTERKQQDTWLALKSLHTLSCKDGLPRTWIPTQDAWSAMTELSNTPLEQQPSARFDWPHQGSGGDRAINSAPFNTLARKPVPHGGSAAHCFTAGRPNNVSPHGRQTTSMSSDMRTRLPAPKPHALQPLLGQALNPHRPYPHLVDPTDLDQCTPIK